MKAAFLVAVNEAKAKLAINKTDCPASGGEKKPYSTGGRNLCVVSQPFSLFEAVKDR